MQALGVVSLVFFSMSAWAQVAPDAEQGMKAYGSYHGGNLDHVSMSNGNLFFHADLMSYSQRGGELAYPVVLQYNSENFSLFNTSCTGTTKPGQQGCPIYVVFGPPWAMTMSSLGNSVSIGYESVPGPIATGGPGPGVNTGLSFNGNPIYVQLSSVLTPDGSLHTLANSDRGTVTLDGSGYFAPNGGSFTDRHGTKFTSLIEDANGNQINPATGQDTLGRSLPPMPGPSSPTATPPASTASLGACPALNYTFQPAAYAYTWSLPTVSGGSLPLVLCYANVWVRTGGATGPGYFDLSQGFTMLQSVVLPDQTYWAFQYDAADPNNSSSVGLADLLKVTLPTGGSITYTWETRTGGAPMNRAVATRVVDANDGHGGQKWQYLYSGYSTVNGNTTMLTTVQDPLGNQTVHTMTGLGGFLALFETQVQYFQGAQSGGTLLKTVATDYQFTPNPWDATAVAGGAIASVTNVFPFRVTTTLPNGLVSKVETDYDAALTYHGPLDGITWNTWTCATPAQGPILENQGGGDACYSSGQTNPVTNYTGSYGKVIAQREYDWGSAPAGGPLLRQTKTAYQWQVNSAYLQANLMDLPASVQVLDGSGNQMALTTYGYDEASLAQSGVTTQFNASPANGSIRGNLTSVHHWLNGSTASTANCPSAVNNGFVVTYTQYNDTGTVASATDACGAQANDPHHTTTHTYDPTYAGAYPTQSCNPLGQCVSAKYDSNTGLTTSFTDANGQTSNFQYDPRWRLTQALGPTDPASGLRPETDFDYSVVNQVKRNRRQSPSAASPTGLPGIVDYAYFDGLGRTKQTRLVDPGGDDFVDTTYDPLGRVSTVSNPHRAASSSTDGITTTYYDTLGRVVQVAPPDGTVLSAGTATTQCQTNNTCTDYSNFPTVTAADQAGMMRRSRSDALGRLVQVLEPGPGTNGPGTSGTGTITISGSLESSTTAGSRATGWFSVSGSDQFVLNCGPSGLCNPKLTPKTWDSGQVSVTVNGVTASSGYGQNSNAITMAGNMAGQMSPHPVTFTNGGNGTINMTADTPGPNYSLSASAFSNDPNDFGAGSFSVGISGATMTGGVYPVTAYDSGTLTVTVNGFQASASYGQNQNNTAAALASALVNDPNNGLNRSGSPVTATVSGSTITLTANGVGLATNYTVAGSSTASFTASSTTLGGGTNPGGLYAPYITNYSYDTLDDLTQVNQLGDASQAARQRTFTYNSLKQLLTATNPESGAITYSYDANGNLFQKTSPAANVAANSTATQIITYCYDVLNRMTGKGYGPQSCPLSSPVVSYTYDQGANAIGHLSSLTDQAGSGSYNYDPLGRMSSEQRTIAGVTKNMSYGYNLDGSLAKLTYPSGASVAYTPDTAGHVLSAIDTGNNINYATGATYGPDGGLTGFVSGGTISNSFSYNPRLQPINMSATSSSGTVFSLNYDFHLGVGDNGNVWGIINNKDATRNQTFTYDPLNRLASAQNAGTDCTQNTMNGKTKFWGNGYTYDAWGNLLAKTVTKCGAESRTVTADVGNRVHVIAGADYQYDAAGNMTYDAVGQYYTYDPENRITGVNGFAYTYDADGNRIEKANGTTGTLYWYMSPGIVAESDLIGNLTSEYTFFDGARVARKDFPSLAVSYYFSDHLKTTDVVTDAQGIIKNESDFYPWGGELQSSNKDSNHYKFTGKERDNETGLDYFGARYYSNGLGRFITPDWAAKATAVPYAELADPQSLNLYSYVRDLPTTQLDLNGHASLEWERVKAVNLAWKQEQAMVRKTGEGTRRWTEAEKAELLGPRGRVKGYYGHHINNVAHHPELAGDPNNIEFLKRDPHFEAHGRNWQLETHGELLNRTGELASRSLAVLQIADIIVNAIGDYRMEQRSGIYEGFTSKLAELAGEYGGTLFISDPAKAAHFLDGESIDVFHDGTRDIYDVRDGQFFRWGSDKPVDSNSMKGAEFDIHSSKNVT